MMLLNIVIPVYNTELYLQQCFDSILASKANDVRVIVVNDGSNDNSLEICRKYEKNNNFVLINQENQGLSGARNVGLHHCTCLYTMFVDSDDYVIPVNFSLFLDILRATDPSIDVLVNDYYKVGYKRFTSSNQCKNINKNDKVAFLNKKGSIWNVWRYIYKTSYLQQNCFIFQEGYLCEDVDFSTKIWLSSCNMRFIDQPFYCYRYSREGSIINTPSVKKISNLYELVNNAIRLTTQHDNEISLLIQKKLLKEALFNISVIYQMEKKQRIEVMSIIEKVINNIKRYKLVDTYYYMMMKVPLRLLGFLLHSAKVFRRAIRFG